jgi:hypothetical protein
MKFVLGSMYVHPGSSQRDTLLLLSHSLTSYARALPNLKPDTETPIIQCGDFNVDITQNKALLEVIKENFDLDCVTESYKTLGNTDLDSTFARKVLDDTERHIS